MAVHMTLLGLSEDMLRLALSSLAQAQTNLFYRDRWHWNERHLITPILTAHAGEILLKAIIARENPLSLFTNADTLSGNTPENVDRNLLLERGITHKLEDLPNIMRRETRTILPDYHSFHELRKLRNKVQHFVLPDAETAEQICKNFIYLTIDPLLAREFGEYACQFHHDEFDDYIVAGLVHHELKFSVPPDLELGEVDISEEILKASPQYQEWFMDQLTSLGLSTLVSN